RSRSPEASVKGVPERCTLVPGAWPAISIFAVEDGRRTGRGSCGNLLPRGASRQMRQARMPETRSSSSGLTSGSSARSAGDRLVPATETDKFVRYGNTRRLHEVDSDQPSDVSDREFIARDELSPGKLAIEELHEFQSLRLVDFAPFGNLRNLP